MTKERDTGGDRPEGGGVEGHSKGNMPYSATNGNMHNDDSPHPVNEKSHHHHGDGHSIADSNSSVKGVNITTNGIAHANGTTGVILADTPSSPDSVKREEGEKEEEEEEDEEKLGCCARKPKKKVPTVGLFQLFKYASLVEIFMMVIGTLAAVVVGCAQPINMIIFGQTLNKFIGAQQTILAQNSTNGTGKTYGEIIQEEMQELIIFFVLVGIVALVTGLVATWLWTWSGERQITRIRKRFFSGVIKQDIGWFDTHEAGEVNSRFSDDMHKIHEGIGDKTPVFVQWVTTFIASYVVAFVQGWKLALVMLAFSPLFIVVVGSMAKLLRTFSVKELKAYAKAGAVAEQALRSIRTVQAFQGQEKEEQKYANNLGDARAVGIRKGLIMGMGQGAFFLVIFITNAVAFYYGIKLIQDEGFKPGNVLTVFFAVLMGSMSMGNAFPNFEAISNARAAAVKIYEIIDRKPVIDVSSDEGIKLENMRGTIEFKDIHFCYPARPDVEVLKGFNLTVQPGETVALVGASGCGKSTTVQLLQRFYDPHSGEVTIDGHRVKDLNLKWLRDQMGVVSQEPVLFAATIAENIRYGHALATMAEIETAAKEANAHNFIMSLPLGYETMIGERGAQLSGGQKQRIAIARALVKNPRIMLLDEATSALDQESEALVQAALEKAQKGRTTFVIAHRLSTIRNADKIVAISQGKKKEEGTHEELVALDGLYAQLIKLQNRAAEEGEDDVLIVEESTEVDEKGDSSHGFLLRSISVTSDHDDTSLQRVDSARRNSTRRNSTKKNVRDRSASVATTDKKEDDAKKKEEEDVKPASSIRLIKMNGPEWVYVTIGTFMSAIAGLSQPCFSFVFAEFLRVFALRDREEQSTQTAILCAIFGSAGVLILIVRLFQGVCFAKAGSELTARIRLNTFKAMMKQDMSYFDNQDNQVGILTTRLASDAAIVQGATGIKLGDVLEAASTLIAALIIAFVYGWKLTLVVLAFLPVMILAGKVQGSVIAGNAQAEKSYLVEAGKICSEAVDNIRTVTSINRADVFISKMDDLMTINGRKGCKTAPVYGLTYGLSVGIIYFAFAACFAVGTKLVADGEMAFFDIFRVFSAIIFGGASVGRNASFGMNYTKARIAASRLFQIMDTVPKIDINQGGKTFDNYMGRVSLDNVVFQYPARPTVPILQGLSLSVDAGHTVALVGSSGCGKSTVMQLLQRFYDPADGTLLVDGSALKSIDLRWFRQQIGIVSQEPTLFDDTIAGNIAYGDNSRKVPMEEIITAARAANIHNFIQALPQGYETSVGDKGTQLSGGQKQRIAIARALVRKPKILLLDEATSALDTESERVVQEALDRASEGRTCIVIAHRLTTIQNADRIAVLHEGKLAEIGTHSQLLAMQGKYWSLLQTQNAPKKDQAE